MIQDLSRRPDRALHPTPSGRNFIAGHDQTAIHKRIAKVGGVVQFLDWFDKVWTEAS